jgi:hypothetical protein
MNVLVATLALLLGAQQVQVACESVPSTWHLGAPVDPSTVLGPAATSGPYTEGKNDLIAALHPGEKIVPFNGITGSHGQAGGVAGYAIIRDGCVVKTLIINAI